MKILKFFGYGLSIIALCVALEWVDKLYNIPVLMIFSITSGLWVLVPKLLKDGK